MICPDCKREIYRYKTYYSNGRTISQCYQCSSITNQPCIGTLDLGDGISISIAEYKEAVKTCIGDGGMPYVDRTGKYPERTLVGKLKQRLPYPI